MPDAKETYPIMPEKNWWEIRRKFIQSLPSSGVSLSYLSTALSISDKAARNVRATMRRIGLIEDDGTIKDRAKQWRDDEQYPKVCSEIRSEIYPSEIRDLFPNASDENKDAIARWFANRTSVGQMASRYMASFYVLLSEADPEGEPEAKPKTQKQKEKSVSVPNNKPKNVQESSDEKVKINYDNVLNTPSININVEVHIASDANATQIDQIFESMAKHLNIRRNNSNG